MGTMATRQHVPSTSHCAGTCLGSSSVLSNVWAVACRSHLHTFKLVHQDGLQCLHLHLLLCLVVH